MHYKELIGVTKLRSDLEFQMSNRNKTDHPGWTGPESFFFLFLLCRPMENDPLKYCHHDLQAMFICRLKKKLLALKVLCIIIYERCQISVKWTKVTFQKADFIKASFLVAIRKVSHAICSASCFWGKEMWWNLKLLRTSEGGKVVFILNNKLLSQNDREWVILDLKRH